MENEHLIRQRIVWWQLKAKRIQQDPVVAFFLYWVCFDAYITDYSGESVDSKKLKWFYNNVSPLKNSYFGGGRDREIAISGLAAYSIEDMRPSSTLPPIRIKTDSNLEEILTAIYRIRCNLFHGSKDLNNQKDIALVTNALLFMKGWIDRYLIT